MSRRVLEGFATTGLVTTMLATFALAVTAGLLAANWHPVLSPIAVSTGSVPLVLFGAALSLAGALLLVPPVDRRERPDR